VKIAENMMMQIKNNNVSLRFIWFRSWMFPFLEFSLAIIPALLRLPLMVCVDVVEYSSAVMVLDSSSFPGESDV